jgi:hypothetical protein
MEEAIFVSQNRGIAQTRCSLDVAYELAKHCKGLSLVYDLSTKTIKEFFNGEAIIYSVGSDETVTEANIRKLHSHKVY